MSDFRIETDSLGNVEVPINKLWGAQTQRALNLFAIGHEKMPPEMIEAYAILKKACALTNLGADKLLPALCDLIVTACDEIIAGEHHEMFPLSVWISGSGTQYNMNVNEVISNRCAQLAGTPLGSKDPVHPNDHVNMCQSTNDNFPSAMYMAAAMGVTLALIPAVKAFHTELHAKASEWKDIVKIGRTHLQDATPLTLGQELSGYADLIDSDLQEIIHALQNVFKLPLGGTAVGTGINTYPGFDTSAVKKIAEISGLPFTPAPNKFTVQGSHNALVHLSGALKGLAVSLNKIACDIRLLACGPRAGIGELVLPANEPGSSIMPGKVNPTQAEALTMVALQVIAQDQAVTLGGTSGILDMNVYKPLMIYNIMHSIRALSDGMNCFRLHLLEGLQPDTAKINEHVNNSLMLVTALNPLIGYEASAKIALHAHREGTTLKEAALYLGLVSEEDFDRVVVVEDMVEPH